jgi:hypothetical protein
MLVSNNGSVAYVRESNPIRDDLVGDCFHNVHTTETIRDIRVLFSVLILLDYTIS